MKRTALAAVILFAASGAAGAAETERYLVATRGGAAELHLSELGIRGDRAAVRPFRLVDGFAADLTQEEYLALRRSPRVDFIEPVVERHALELRRDVGAVTPRARPARSFAGSGALQPAPYGIAMVAADSVWPHGRGAGIRVGIIDTGIDYSHPDLEPHYEGGWDFVNNDADPMDDHAHGTHVAGTVAAMNNTFGVVGVAPEARLYALKVLDSAGSGTNEMVIRAVEWAIENELHVINLSLGSTDRSFMEQEMFERAEDAGILAVAATGNDFQGTEFVGFPAAYPSVIAVGAIDANREIAPFSQRGTEIDIVAPGVGIRSTALVGRSLGGVVTTAAGATFEANLFEPSPHGTLAGQIVHCGLGYPADFPAEVSGKIALIQRGEIGFGDKVYNAMQAGAIGAVIYNNVSGNFLGRLTRAGTATWPVVVSVSDTDGAALRATSGMISVGGFDYQDMQGTSMATPHVAGAAALIWSLAPTARPSSVRDALLNNANDLGAAGWDSTFGSGLVNSYAAARALAPALFDSAPPAGPRRRAARRG